MRIKKRNTEKCKQNNASSRNATQEIASSLFAPAQSQASKRKRTQKKTELQENVRMLLGTTLKL